MARTPEAAAEGMLQFTWAEDGEIRIPVDAAKIAHRLGIQIFEANLPADVSGTIVKGLGKDPVITLNRTDSKPRQRFSCAHELGHFDEHAATGDDEHFEYIEQRAGLASTGLDAAERYANRFAAALLMPESLLRRHAARGPSVVELADRFGVSVDAMNYRLKNLQLIP